MAEKTKIGWCTSTFNPWVGCTEVGPGCDNCYARELDKRHKWGGATHWGVGVPRHRTAEATWEQVLKWNKKQEQAFSDYALGKTPKPEPWRVFCASLADVFDNEVPHIWQAELWELIKATPYLSWLIVTKRIGNVERFVPWGWYKNGFPDNVRLLISICNQEEADRDIPKLLALPCKNGISYEPALGPVDWRYFFSLVRRPDTATFKRAPEPEPIPRSLLQWIIVGGESTQGKGKARPFDREWAYSTIRQCKAAGVPCFVKQLGSNVLARNDEHGYDIYAPRFLHRAGAHPTEWPEDLRVQQFPES